MKKNILYSIVLLCTISSPRALAQKDIKETDEQRRVKAEHEQIGIVTDSKASYKRTTSPDAQWYPEAAFGMFIHWSIISVKERDVSWPMIAGFNRTWSTKPPAKEEVEKYLKEGNYFAGNICEKNNNCLTPSQYWDLAKEFNPSSYNPETWAKQAKEAGMTYMVLTTRHHDGFALWPSKYGDFSTKNYMKGRDLVKEYVAACRKYGLKVGLYYSGPDWYFDRDFQNFLSGSIAKIVPEFPELDPDLNPRSTKKTDAEKQQHYDEVAAYLSGQIEELLTNYGKIDLLWFDGGPSIPGNNSARKKLITMERIHQLQPGIVVNRRFFGYGDFTTLEDDKNKPKTILDGWAELCTTSQQGGWGYNKSPIKSLPYSLDLLATCRSMNTNFLFNFAPDKNGVFSKPQTDLLNNFAAWMKVNASAIKGTHALDPSEQASVPAVAKEKHRYLFVIPKGKNSATPDILPIPAETITLKTAKPIKSVQILGQKVKIKYEEKDGQVTIEVPSEVRTISGDVIDVVLN